MITISTIEEKVYTKKLCNALLRNPDVFVEVVILVRNDYSYFIQRQIGHALDFKKLDNGIYKLKTNRYLIRSLVFQQAIYKAMLYQEYQEYQEYQGCQGCQGCQQAEHTEQTEQAKQVDLDDTDLELELEPEPEPKEELKMTTLIEVGKEVDESVKLKAVMKSHEVRLDNLKKKVQKINHIDNLKSAFGHFCGEHDTTVTFSVCLKGMKLNQVPLRKETRDKIFKAVEEELLLRFKEMEDLLSYIQAEETEEVAK